MSGRRQKPRTLVIDDEQLVANFVEELLIDEGFVVEAVLSGREGRDRLRNNEYDLVVVDKNLPDMSGLDLLAEVRRLRPQARVVLVTAYGTIESALDALQRGAADYILKPIDDVDRFVARLREALQRPVPDGAPFDGLVLADLPRGLGEAIETLRSRLTASAPA